MKKINYVYICVCVWVCAHVCSALGGQKEALDPLELELEVIVGCLMWVWALILGLLEEQLALLTT